MDADAVELRVLGCLIEKQRTTPDAYPLSLNALRAACNQTTNRDPIVGYDEPLIREGLERLSRRRWVRLASGPGSRAVKYRHLFDEALSLDGAEVALLCVLMLRGPQTAGELKGRSERLHPFASLTDVEEALAALAGRELVVRLARRPGQKEQRFAHLLSGDAPAQADEPAAAGPQPAPRRRGRDGPAQKAFGPFPRFDPEQGVTVLAPERPGAGNWVGCASVLYDPVRERVLLTYRSRRPRGEADDRGYRCAVAESADGVAFTDLWSIAKRELETTSMERFNLHRDPDGRYLLYLSYEDPEDGRWRIDVLEDSSPDAFDPARRRAVLTAGGTGTAAVKDPYVVRAGPAYLMFVSTFLTDAGPAPTFLATSVDGIRFDWAGEVLGVGSGWDRYQARLSGIVRSGSGYVGFYDGAAGPEEDTEERLGIALSGDLVRWERLSPRAPWLVSPHATGSLRYVDAIPLDGEWWLYYEYARPDGSHELRLSRVPLAD